MKIPAIIATTSAVILAVCSCSPKLTSSIISQQVALDVDEEVAIVPQETDLPEDAQFIGTLKITDSGFTSIKNGTTEKVMELAREQARSRGGNIVRIIESIPPDLNCTTHRLEAEIYRIDDISSIVPDGEAALFYDDDREIALSQAQIPASPESSSTPKLRFAVQGGFGYLLGKVDKTMGPDMIDYQKKLKSGFTDGAELSYLFLNGYSAGIKYSHMRSAVSVYGTLSYEDGTTKTGTLSDDISIIFIGPFLGTTTAGYGSKHIFSLNVGLGYIGYKDNVWVITPYELSGWTLGYYLGFEYDFMISRRIAIGAEIDYYSGSISEVDKTEQGVKSKLEQENNLSASHFEASIGVRLYL